MAIEFIPFGEPYPALSNDYLVQAIVRKTLTACLASKDYEVIELRHLIRDDDKLSDIIIVDCVNDQVPTRNSADIKVRERLALMFTPEKIPEVRALRKDFPVDVPHLWHVPPNEPASLCLYEETWSTLERTWTPHIHLRRILGWLSDTARGTLHRNNQPLEPMYFESPYEILLPPDYEENLRNPDLVLIPFPIKQSNGSCRVIRGLFQHKNKVGTQKSSNNRIAKLPIIAPFSGKFEISKGGLLMPPEKTESYEPLNINLLTVRVSPIVHGSVEKYPETLGQLHDQFQQREATFLEELNEIIRKEAEGGLLKDASSKCVLVISIPMKRTDDSDPEEFIRRAFQLDTDLADLGEMTGALMRGPEGKLFYSIGLIAGTEKVKCTKWREIKVCPVEVKTGLTKDFAREASAVDGKTADFRGVLAGVGALGSALAELWAKEYWGEWSLIDPDFIKSHNIVRHTGKDIHIGLFKVDVVKEMVEMNYYDGYYPVTAIPQSSSNLTNKAVKSAITTADFLVDATTTLEVPRDISQEDDAPRSSSVFVTPSGQDSVFLIEATDRTVRLDGLEAQYYKAVITSDWGASHLDGHRGDIRVGAGCRDMSVIMSNETIQFHAALLARQVRLLRDQPAACIRVWATNFETGDVEAHEIPVHEQLCFQCSGWRIIWDNEIKQKLCEIRNAHLPNETGGVILGYIDQKLKAIYIVDVLKAPSDSEASETGFTRGVQGLETVLKEVTRRTANIVSYIGEWHSHPAFTSPYPSNADRDLIEELARTLALDGQPALMIIVGAAEEISISVKEE